MPSAHDIFEFSYHSFGVLALRLADKITVNNPYVFFGVSALVVAYLLYMMIRKRKGERPGSAIREPEL